MERSRIILVVFAVLFSMLMKMDRHPTATVYYISKQVGASNSNNGTSMATPWATVSKLNSVTLVPGDQVLFRRGDTWNEALVPNQSGSAGNPIIYDAYGSGSNPVFSGFTSLTSWTVVSGTLWSATLPAGASETMVTVNGAITSPGRFPNTGWLTMTTGGSSSFTTSHPNPDSYNDGNVVIKKRQWMIDKQKITSITSSGPSGGTINFTNTTGYPARTGWGFFFTDHPNTCDLQNEWYYQPGTPGSLFMRSSGNPSANNVKAAVLPTVLNINNKNYIKIQNLTFEGSTANLVEIEAGNGNQIISCDLRFAGKLGMNANYMINFLMSACNIYQTNYSGIDAIFGQYQKFVGNTFSYNGMKVELCGPHNKANHALWVNGDRNVMEYNHVYNIGYVGIDFSGSYDTCQYNYIHDFCQIATDGGGIYMSDEPDKFGRYIANNIVLRGLGPLEGSAYDNGAPASGFDDTYDIYLDEATGHVRVENNLGAYTNGGGMYFHRAANDTAVGNTFAYNLHHQMRAAEDLDENPQKIFNGVFNNNTLISGSADASLYSLYGAPSITSFFTQLNNNLLLKNSTSSKWVTVVQSYTTFTDHTIASFKSTYPVYNTTTLSAPTEFNSGMAEIFTNPTAAIVTLPLEGTYKKIDGTNYNSGSIALAPYGFAVMKRTGNLPVVNTTVNLKGRIIISNGP